MRGGGYCYHPRGGGRGYCYRPARGGYCYRPARRGMGEVSVDNLWRMGVAAFAIGAGFIIVSGQLEKRQSKRRKKRRG